MTSLAVKKMGRGLVDRPWLWRKRSSVPAQDQSVNVLNIDQFFSKEYNYCPDSLSNFGIPMHLESGKQDGA